MMGRGFFYGWYLKCQSSGQTLAVIPAIHRNGRKRTCSLQVITEDGAWTADFPARAFRRAGKNIFIGRNRFGPEGLRLAVHAPGLSMKGRLYFGPLTPLKYDIMGPFALVPFLECRHSVRSMHHSVSGTVWVNGREFRFQEGDGYWEGDSGRSFPREYVWTQCCFPGGSLLLSVAEIPLAGLRFQGIIAAVLWQGREYRLATYLGARVVRLRRGVVRIVQGNMELEATLLKRAGKALKAPLGGSMARTIHESAATRARYRFRKDGNTVFSFETDRASFEYEYSWR